MKTSNPTNIEVRKKAIEFDIIDLFQALAITFLIIILSILLYKSFYWWSIGIIVVSYGAIRIYSFYKEFVNYDWSIDVSDFTTDDMMADLEGNYNTDKNQKSQKVVTKTLK